MATPSDHSKDHFYCDLSFDMTVSAVSENWSKFLPLVKPGSNFLEATRAYSGFFVELLSKIGPDNPICSAYNKDDGQKGHSFQEIRPGTLWVIHGFFSGRTCAGYRVVGHDCVPCKIYRKDAEARLRKYIDILQYLQSEMTILSAFLVQNTPPRKILGKIKAALDKISNMVQIGYREVTSFSCQIQPALKKPVALPFPKQESGTILIVEDDKPIREMTRRILETRGYTVLTAASAEEAFGILEDFLGEVDLFVIDLGLPGMSGLDFVRILFQENPDSKIIILTGFLGSESQDDEVSDKVIHWLEKPISPNELVTYVKSAIKKQEEVS